MAQVIESFAPVWASGESSQKSLKLSRPLVVDVIEILVPDGNNGLLTFYLLNAGQQVIPVVSGEVIQANAETLKWPVTQFLDSGSWQIHGNNIGSFSHTLYVRFLCHIPTVQDQSLNGVSGPVLVPITSGLPGLPAVPSLTSGS